jgi:hypothetical protein
MRIIKAGVMDDVSVINNTKPGAELFAPERIQWVGAVEGANQVKGVRTSLSSPGLQHRTDNCCIDARVDGEVSERPTQLRSLWLLVEHLGRAKTRCGGKMCVSLQTRVYLWHLGGCFLVNVELYPWLMQDLSSTLPLC